MDRFLIGAVLGSTGGALTYAFSASLELSIIIGLALAVLVWTGIVFVFFD